MIDESYPWRVELLDVAGRLEGRKKQRRWVERTSFLIERDVMVSAYAIRKLQEANKLSSRVENAQIPVFRYPLKGPIPNFFNLGKIDKQYDLDSPIKCSLSIRYICNQLIHSYVWNIAINEECGGLAGMFIASDKTRKTSMYFVSIDSFIDVLREVGNDDICFSKMSADKDGVLKPMLKLSQKDIDLLGGIRLVFNEEALRELSDENS